MKGKLKTKTFFQCAIFNERSAPKVRHNLWAARFFPLHPKCCTFWRMDYISLQQKGEKPSLKTMNN